MGNFTIQNQKSVSTVRYESETVVATIEVSKNAQTGQTETVMVRMTDNGGGIYLGSFSVRSNGQEMVYNMSEVPMRMRETAAALFDEVMAYINQEQEG